MKKIFAILTMAVTLMVLWGCSKSDDDNVNNNKKRFTSPLDDISTWVVDLNKI